MCGGFALQRLSMRALENYMQRSIIPSVIQIAMAKFIGNAPRILVHWKHFKQVSGMYTERNLLRKSKKIEGKLYHFYILIRESIRFMHNVTPPPPFLSNVHVLRPLNPKIWFLRMCLSVCLSVCRFLVC